MPTFSEVGLRRPTQILVRLHPGHPWVTDAPIVIEGGAAFPNAPVVTFGDGSKWTCTLSSDKKSATCTATSSQVDAVVTGGSMTVDISDPVTGRVWALGRYEVVRTPSSGGSGLAPVTAGQVIVGPGVSTATDLLGVIKGVDGAGSGLDADLLDGLDSTAFARSAHGHAMADVNGLQAALDGKLATSGTAADSAKLGGQPPAYYATATALAATNADLTLKTDGSPEGVVTAPVGTLCRSTDPAKALGARLWYKQTGTGNTGWVVAVGDTGWRTLPIIDGWTGGTRVRRIGPVVYLQINNVNPAASTSARFVAVPTGFTRYGGAATFPVASSAGGYQPLAINVADATVTQTQGVISAVGWSTFTWPTNDAWPTTLPGTAA